MATRKPWASLSEGYRDRLARKGITAKDHATGSLKEARGHKQTPEHPKQAVDNPEKFKKYMATRSQLIQQVKAKKERLWGQDHKYRPRSSNKIVSRGFDGEHPPSLKMLQWAINANESELLEKMTSGDEDYSFLWYH